MRYDNDVSPMGGWQRRDEPVRYAPFRGQPVDDVHTRHSGEHPGRRERGDFVTRGLSGRGEVDPRANLVPLRGETDFLGRPYGPAAYQNVPRGLYDQEHRQAALGRGYDRGFGARGYDRSMRGYDRGMRGHDHAPARYDHEYWVGRGYDGGMRGARPRGHGGGMGYGQDYEAVRDRFGAGPMQGRPMPGDPRWSDRWPRR
jgi:hypothetical protein